jgi:hypothetical protein
MAIVFKWSVENLHMCSCCGNYIVVSHCACADAADKAKAEGLASLNLGQKIRAFMGALQPAYWQALSVVCLLYFARFDASFITLRARTVRLAACIAHHSCHT